MASELVERLTEWAHLFGESYRNEASLMSKAATTLSAQEEQIERDKARKEVDMLLSTAAAIGDEPDLMLQEFDRLNAELAAAREQIAALEKTIAENTDGLWYKRQVAFRLEATEARRALSSAQERIARMREALTEIARQKLVNELNDDEHENANYAEGYESCVQRARAALTLAKEKTDGQ